MPVYAQLYNVYSNINFYLKINRNNKQKTPALSNKNRATRSRRERHLKPVGNSVLGRVFLFALRGNIEKRQ